MRIVLVTPPLVQLNTPFTTTPVLTRFLRQQGLDVEQRDFSLETALAVFTPDVVRRAAAAAKAMKQRDDTLDFFLESADDYARTILPVIRFLQGKSPELAWRIAARTFLPEGPYFQALWTSNEAEDEDEQNLHDAFGRMGTQDRAKYLASLYMDDLSSFIAQTLDEDFNFGKYAEALAVDLPTLDPMLERLNRQPTLVDEIIDKLAKSLIENQPPLHVLGLTIPFPGTLYGALRIAQTIRKLSPATRILIGGGYVNSELRSLEDKRIFDLVDFILFDEGFLPLLAICQDKLTSATSTEPTQILSSKGFHAFETTAQPPACFAPDYIGLDLGDYFDVVEMPNPMYRIWSDGKWLKMQLATGCYWHKCAFCDVALDYIKRYCPAPVDIIVDEMERLVNETGRTGFHFVDEALSPALLASLSKEIISRNLTVTWWGNIRFDKAFNAELAQLMADAGCVAVTGGLECAHDRLLKLMNKGITLASARNVLQALADAGIMTHAYLMYAFPTETEKEAMDALAFVRDCFADGILHSAFWHRFALTAHSPIAQHPETFSIALCKQQPVKQRFALNEIPFTQPHAPDWSRIGRALETAVYNYMLGLGMELPPKAWFKR